MGMTQGELTTDPALSNSPGAMVAASVPKTKTKRKKVRGVWISFIGRIVAQFVGSAATIVLGLMLLNRYQPSLKPQTATASAAESADARLSSAPVSVSADDLSIAVLPLLNFSPDPTQQYVADSMSEILTTQLAQLPGLHVASRTSAMTFRGQQASVREIAAALGVRYILEGSTAEIDGIVRVTAQLIDAARDEHLWARTYDRRAENILTVEDEVATAIVRELNATYFERDGATSTSGSVALRGAQAETRPVAHTVEDGS
jgi:TolB-like protein